MRLLHALPRHLALAVGMLTVLRIPVPGTAGPAELRRSTALYPLVGLLVGVAPAVILFLPLPELPRAMLALAAWVLVTGALHLDGWADCCDAALAPPGGAPEETRERRLAILKDPRLGTFGVVGLVLLLLLKGSALASVPAIAPLFAAPVGRWTMVLLLRAIPPARPDGLGATFSGAVPIGAATGMLAAVLVALLAILLPLSLWGWPLGAVLAGMLAGALIGAFLARRFGGVTGDVCGAAGEGAELAVLLALLSWGAG